MSSHRACNGLQAVARITGEAVAVFPRALGVTADQPHVAGLGSILKHPLRHRSLPLRAQAFQAPIDEISREDPRKNEARCLPGLDRRTQAQWQNGTQTLSAVRHCRAAIASTVRMEDTPVCMRKVRARRTMKRQHLDRRWCRDHISRFLFPQDSNRYLPFLFHDARVGLGLLATECRATRRDWRQRLSTPLTPIRC